MNTYSWNIDKVTTIKFMGGQYDVVSQVDWHMTATAGVLKTDYYGTTPIPTDDLTVFVPYASLTNDDIIAWLNEYVDVPWVQSCLDMQIRQLQEPQSTIQNR